MSGQIRQTTEINISTFRTINEPKVYTFLYYFHFMQANIAHLKKNIYFFCTLSSFSNSEQEREMIIMMTTMRSFNIHAQKEILAALSRDVEQICLFHSAFVERARQEMYHIFHCSLPLALTTRLMSLFDIYTFITEHHHFI